MYLLAVCLSTAVHRDTQLSGHTTVLSLTHSSLRNRNPLSRWYTETAAQQTHRISNFSEQPAPTSGKIRGGHLPRPEREKKRTNLTKQKVSESFAQLWNNRDFLSMCNIPLTMGKVAAGGWMYR